MEFVSRLQGNIARLSLTALLLGVMAVGLAACGTEATPTPAPPTASAATDMQGAPTSSGATSSGTMAEIKSTLSEFSIVSSDNAAPAGKVKFIVSNEGQFPHNLAVRDGAGNEVGQSPVFEKKDGVKDVEVDLVKGVYKLVCTVPGHEAKGMIVDFTVK